MLECAANLACVGAEPLGLTNCLNFGNPEKPHIAWQLSESVRGMADACRALGRAGRRRQRLALQRGAGGADLPDARRRHGRPDAGRARAPGGSASPSRATRSPSAVRFQPSLPGSELAKLRGEPLPDGLPEVDVALVRKTLEVVRDAVRAAKLRSAHDVAEGGFAVALAECCLGRRARRAGRLPRRHRATASLEVLFGEGPGGFVLSGPRPALAALAREIQLAFVGVVGGDEARWRCRSTTTRRCLATRRAARGALAGAGDAIG